MTLYNVKKCWLEICSKLQWNITLYSDDSLNVWELNHIQCDYRPGGQRLAFCTHHSLRSNGTYHKGYYSLSVICCPSMCRTKFVTTKPLSTFSLITDVRTHRETANYWILQAFNVHRNNYTFLLFPLQH